jgi:tetratricopeptide (TPR) repeat protein
MIADSLKAYLEDPRDPMYNFNLARDYEENGQLSSAISFYLRAAEYSLDKLLSYESLLRMSACLDASKNRNHSLKGILLRAIALMPNRPEAYYLLARTYERIGSWHDCYTYACIGEDRFKFTSRSMKELITDVDYPGVYAFTFERAVSAWWVGLWDESVALLRKLSKMKLNRSHEITVESNLKNIGGTWKKSIFYKDFMYRDLRYKFPGSESIKENYSQAYQDMFVLAMNNGKREGTFVEIGCEGPVWFNNTLLLERDFGWSGVSIDINPAATAAFNKERKAKTVTGDATKLDYDSILDRDTYDYLQVDCEPAINTFKALQKIDLSKRKFGVITFEHDNYVDQDPTIMEKSRKYLESFGYVMVVNNISQNNYSPFEDWWVHPDLIDKDIIDKMKSVSGVTKRADLYMLNKI